MVADNSFHTQESDPETGRQRNDPETLKHQHLSLSLSLSEKLQLLSTVEKQKGMWYNEINFK
jgi:hypothetical protein